jgi:hypothetical protein
LARRGDHRPIRDLPAHHDGARRRENFGMEDFGRNWAAFWNGARHDVRVSPAVEA